MAKLSAHGAELARLKVTRIAAEDDANGVAERYTHLSFRTDGHIMQREVIRWREDSPMRYYDGSPATHDYGWKLYQRFKPEVRKDRAALKRAVEARVAYLTDRHIGRGHRVESTISPL
jgi:hypothetical protein